MIPQTLVLIFGMASIQDVMESFKLTVSKGKNVWDIEEQDRFANYLNACRLEFPPSERYLRALLQLYISEIDRVEGVEVESDALMEIVLEVSQLKEEFPDPHESSYLSFFINSKSNKSPSAHALRIRQFPYHNDISLRLWEAGACLAEFFLAHSSLVVDKKVVELGAGVGLTGFIIAGCCGASKVHLTDCTDECLLNLEHNIAINQSWLKKYSESANISQGYLEWSEFVDCKRKEETSFCNVEFNTADILIAADVTYDVSVIESLVAVIQSFLLNDPDNKEVIFAITKRNLNTFDLFLEQLKRYQVTSNWIASGEECERLPRICSCNFNQPRSDVQIARLQLIQS